jgi:hypothetical protein
MFDKSKERLKLFISYPISIKDGDITKSIEGLSKYTIEWSVDFFNLYHKGAIEKCDIFALHLENNKFKSDIFDLTDNQILCLNYALHLGKYISILCKRQGDATYHLYNVRFSNTSITGIAVKDYNSIEDFYNLNIFNRYNPMNLCQSNFYENLRLQVSLINEEQGYDGEEKANLGNLQLDINIENSQQDKRVILLI